MKALKLNYLILLVVCGLISACEEKNEPTPTFSLSAEASPVEGGTITISPTTGPYIQGQNVTITPQPNTNWIFKEWDGDASGNSNPLSLIMNSNKSVTGVFVKRDYPLNITIEGEGTVTEVIVTNPSGREYPHGTTVELTPVPTEGWKFDSWGGDLSGSEVPQRITVEGVKNVRVKFICIHEDDPIFYLAENGITCKCEKAIPGEKGIIDGITFEAVDNELLRQRKVQNVDMTKLCTSLVTDMRELFFDPNFNQPIGNWDVSKVTDMSYMFAESPFNHPLDHWDVSKVTNMSYMFVRSQFNHPLEHWDVSNVANMAWMFYRSTFNQPIEQWDVSNVSDMNHMFLNSAFNQPIGIWDVSKVENMSSMFNGSPFNQPIGDWNVGNVVDMGGIFVNTPFNQPLDNWNVSKVENMMAMFGGSAFNQPIGNWDVSKVIDMTSMFDFSKFNQPIGDWNVSNVRIMGWMFYGSPFNQPIGNWDVSNVTEMWGMFGAWEEEIPEIQFNQPIGNWDVSNVIDMSFMFENNSHFNQDLSKWCVEQIPTVPENFSIGATAWVLPKPVWGTCPD